MATLLLLPYFCFGVSKHVVDVRTDGHLESHVTNKNFLRYMYGGPLLTGFHSSNNFVHCQLHQWTTILS